MRILNHLFECGVLKLFIFSPLQVRATRSLRYEIRDLLIGENYAEHVISAAEIKSGHPSPIPGCTSSSSVLWSVALDVMFALQVALRRKRWGNEIWVLWRLSDCLLLWSD